MKALILVASLILPFSVANASQEMDLLKSCDLPFDSVQAVIIGLNNMLAGKESGLTPDQQNAVFAYSQLPEVKAEIDRLNVDIDAYLKAGITLTDDASMIMSANVYYRSCLQMKLKQAQQPAPKK